MRRLLISFSFAIAASIAACSATEPAPASNPDAEAPRVADGADGGSARRDASESDASSAADAAPRTWTAVSLDFDDVASGPVAQRFADIAKFSASNGDDVFVYDVPANCGQSQPNILVSGSTPGVGDGELRIEFVRTVRKLRLHALGVNDTGDVAELAFYKDGALVESMPLVGKGTYSKPIPLDFTSVGEIDTFEIKNVTDGYGLMWDDFEFEMVDP